MSNKKEKQIVANNLQRLLDAKGKTQTDMAKDLNFPEMTVSNWMRAETYPRIDRLQQMADYFGVYRSDITEEKPSNLYTIAEESVHIPILGEIACGDPIYVSENFAGYRTEPKETLPSGNSYYLQAKGDSMEPTIPSSAYVLIREQADVENGEIAAVLLNGDTEATLKRVKKQGKALILMPDNSKHDPIFITAENPVKIIGKAIRFTMDL